MQILKVFQGQKITESKIRKSLQKHNACSFGFKLLCAEPFITYLDEDAVYNFINNMTKGSKYWSEVMKKRFNEDLLMPKDNENFKKSSKYWICDND